MYKSLQDKIRKLFFINPLTSHLVNVPKFVLLNLMLFTVWTIRAIVILTLSTLAMYAFILYLGTLGGILGFVPSYTFDPLTHEHLFIVSCVIQVIHFGIAVLVYLDWNKKHLDKLHSKILPKKLN